MAIRQVGPSRQYHTVSAAVAAAQDGDSIVVDGGVYNDDIPPVIRVSLTFLAASGRVVMKATKNISNGKGLIIAGGSSGNPVIKFNGFDFIGAIVTDGNGAGIRWQAGSMTCTNCSFQHCQNGILATPFVAGTGSILLDRCEIAFCGKGDGQTHGAYIGHIANFQAINCYVHDTKVGHHLKTRAQSSTISNCRLYDNAETSSYAIDCPNAGDLVVTSCTIQQSASGQNPYLTTYGVGGASNPGRIAHLTSCVVVNDKTGVRLTYNSVSGTTVLWADCDFWGVPDNAQSLGVGAVARQGPLWLRTRPELDMSSPCSEIVSVEAGQETPSVDDEPLPSADVPDPEPEDDEGLESGGK